MYPTPSFPKQKNATINKAEKTHQHNKETSPEAKEGSAGVEKEQSRRSPLAETQIKTHGNEKTLMQQKKGEMNHPMTADAGKEKRLGAAEEWAETRKFALLEINLVSLSMSLVQHI